MAHLKRLNTPKSWKILKKENTWITRPSPGAHKPESSIPLAVALRDVLGFADTLKEVKYILKQKSVLVNGKVQINPKFAVGLMDVLELPAMKKKYKVKLDKKGMLFFEEAEKADNRLCRVEGKKIIKGKKTQSLPASGQVGLAGVSLPCRVFLRTRQHRCLLSLWLFLVASFQSFTSLTALK